MPPQSSKEAPQTASQAAHAVRSEWRRNELIAAATQLMSSEGFASVSIQAIAAKAEVSTGLIYRYYRNKEDLLLAVIVDVLQTFADQIPLAREAAGEDPVEQVASMFSTYCSVIDSHRHAAVLTYREGRHLDTSSRDEIKRLEQDTTKPLKEAIEEAQACGQFRSFNTDLFTYDLILMAHGWALKHWYFHGSLTIDEYIEQQTAVFLRSALAPDAWNRYQHLLEPTQQPDAETADNR